MSSSSCCSSSSSSDGALGSFGLLEFGEGGLGARERGEEEEREWSSRWIAASCWRRKNSFCCLERDSSTAEAIFFETSEMEACLRKSSVHSLRRVSESGAERIAGSRDYRLVLVLVVGRVGCRHLVYRCTLH